MVKGNNLGDGLSRQGYARRMPRWVHNQNLILKLSSRRHVAPEPRPPPPMVLAGMPQTQGHRNRWNPRPIRRKRYRRLGHFDSPVLTMGGIGRGSPSGGAGCPRRSFDTVTGPPSISNGRFLLDSLGDRPGLMFGGERSPGNLCPRSGIVDFPFQKHQRDGIDRRAAAQRALH